MRRLQFIRQWKKKRIVNIWRYGLTETSPGLVLIAWEVQSKTRGNYLIMLNVKPYIQIRESTYQWVILDFYAFVDLIFLGIFE